MSHEITEMKATIEHLVRKVSKLEEDIADLKTNEMLLLHERLTTLEGSNSDPRPPAASFRQMENLLKT